MGLLLILAPGDLGSCLFFFFLHGGKMPCKSASLWKSDLFYIVFWKREFKPLIAGI